jgi:hypothetical protein
MNEFLGYIGMGVAVFALVGPLAYCEVKRRDANASIEKACIEARGEWTTGWGHPYCKRPGVQQNTGGSDE